LLEQVEDGRLSLYTALRQAGIVIGYSSVRNAPPSFARAIFKHFTLDQRRQIAEWIVAKEMPPEIAARRKS
jgi:hypothetical protein